MEAFTDEVYKSMVSALNKINAESENLLQQAERSYRAVKNALQKISSFMAGYTFSKPEEEILFFKTIKPKFLRELIFFAELYHLEAGKPAAERKAQEHFIKETMIQIRLYFERNQDFYNYYRSGKTHLDHVYFLRNQQDFDQPPEYAADQDPSGFSTYYSFKLSRLLALEQLKAHIDNSLPIEGVKTNGDDALKWTDNKVGLIELAYSLHAKGAFNNGNLEIKQIIAVFENIFHVDLGNYYGVFQQNIRLRKKNRTQYLDQLKERLENRMDDEDENPRF